MPLTCAASSPELGIRLKGDKAQYSPGDTIGGCVFRKSPIKSQIASLSIQLVGRTRSKAVGTEGNQTFTTRGRFNIIPRQLYTRKLFEKPLRITGHGENAWHFEMSLPKYADPSDLKGRDQSESYLPLRGTDCPLPSSFALITEERTEAFVEYFLRATLRSRRGSSVDTWVATLPITVTNPSSPMLDFELQRSHHVESMVSYTLMPKMENAKLSLSQIIKQTLATSSVPRLEFELQVDMPGVVQLNNPATIPVRLRAVPDWSRTSRNLKDTHRRVRLQWVSMQIVATTEIICEGSHAKEEKFEADLSIMSQIYSLGKPVHIPLTEDGSFVDIGDLIGLSLDGYVNSCPRHRGDVIFTPTFTTYNIRLSHRLKWKVRAEVAGQSFEAVGAKMLTILGPSRELREPTPRPSEDGRLPSFVQAEALGFSGLKGARIE